MTTGRDTQAGVTLIEMLAALAISALIGVAGFTLLESVLQTEAGVADRLDQLAQHDRAFQLLALDLQQAASFEVMGNGGIGLDHVSHSVVWRGGKDGLERRIVIAGRETVIQTPLTDAARLGIDPDNAGLVSLRLPEHDVRRVFHLPPERGL